VTEYLEYFPALLHWRKTYIQFVELDIMAGRRNCLNSPDSFCYICGCFTVPSQRTSISDFVKKAYFAYFHVKIGDQDKAWAPHIVCKSCVENLRQWTKGQRNKLAFGIPMIWRESKNHVDDCYFCLVQTSGYNKKTKSKIVYPSLESAIRPVAHSDEIPVPVFNISLSLEEEEAMAEVVEHDVDFVDDDDDTGACSNRGPQCFNQQELNDLVRDLALSKELSELLASRLSEKKLLEQGTKITFYRKREYDLLQYFRVESGLVYCHDVSGLVNAMGVTSYHSNEWRMFLDSSKSSLKCVLLHNGNFYGSIPIGHSIHLKEKYEDVGKVLKLLKYDEHKWIICVDLKMVNLLLGQQGGYTKYPCFSCLWDSRDRDKHWTQKNWPVRTSLEVGKKNVINQPLVDREKIIFPPLHIKLGIMKQYVRALDEGGNCFKYICEKLPRLSYEKIKAGVFNGPEIRTLMKDPHFTNSMNDVEKDAWNSFVAVINNFLGNNKSENYKDLVETLLANFHRLGCNMSIKLHFLNSHLDGFPENLGDVSDEQGERFHQDLKIMEERYQGRWDTHMMADYCWSIKRDCGSVAHSRKSSKRKFLP
jgi:hypothetical protein